MKGPFSPLPIICEHFRAFRDLQGRILWSSLVFYLFLPLVATLLRILGGVVVSAKLVDILITSMSICGAAVQPSNVSEITQLLQTKDLRWWCQLLAEAGRTMR